MLSLSCPECGAELRAPDDVLGKKVKCPKCRHAWVALDLPADLLADLSAEPPAPPAPPPKAAAKPTDKDPRVGQTLGDFELRGLLGKGGFGSVYEAQDTLLQRTVAIKILLPEVAADPQVMAQFIAEARAASLVRHPNMVAIYQVGRNQGVVYIVMEIVRGGSCAEWLKKKGPMSEGQATWITAEAARGLSAAHKRGIVHRDIKPANLMLNEEGVVKLTDFGLAMRTAGMTTSKAGGGEVVGTPSYMSPEQCRGEAVDARSDLYSLGATYYALLVGKPPFQAESTTKLLMKHLDEPVPDPRRLRADIPEGAVKIISKAMEKDPADRFQTADEFAEALGNVDFG